MKPLALNKIRSAKKTGLYSLLVIIAIIVPWHSPLFAHEPIFGVGPHTMYEGGIGIEIEGELSKDESINNYEMEYGITPDFTATIKIPVVFVHGEDKNYSGLGDISLRFKWRFIRIDAPGASDGVALVGGIKFPTGTSGSSEPTGTGSTDFLTAITYGHESLRWYWWTDVWYLITTEGAGINRGDIFFYDAAFGVRPWILSYEQPDLVVLLEINGRHTGKSRRGDKIIPDTGGNLITAGPAILFSYRNYMFKGGIAFPVTWSLNGSQSRPHTEGVIGIEGHF